jgi:CRP-like cAMP-binding protein
MTPRHSPFKVAAETLCGIDIFSGLDTESREGISKLCTGRHYQPEQPILSQSDGDRDVFFIVSGTVKIAVYSNSGKEVIFRDLGAGRMFGELAAIDNKRRSAYVHAIEETALIVLSQDDFFAVLVEYPNVGIRTMQYLAGLVRSLSDRVFEYDALSVNSRVHTELLRLAHDNLVGANRAEISPAPTHGAFAAHIGTHREAVTREFSKMRKMGLVERRGRKLIINDVSVIERLVKQNINEPLIQHIPIPDRHETVEFSVRP